MAHPAFATRHIALSEAILRGEIEGSRECRIHRPISTSRIGAPTTAVRNCTAQASSTAAASSLTRITQTPTHSRPQRTCILSAARTRGNHFYTNKKDDP